MSYHPSWDLPHEVEAADTWQESDCYWWFDSEAGVGGWHRVGQYLNQGIGQSSVYLYQIGGKRFLDRNIEVPISDCQRSETGQRVGKSAVENLSPQVMAYFYKDPKAAFELTFSDSFYTPRDWMQAEGHERALATEAGHLEVAGRVTGQVRIGDRNFEVNALAHRDRSWGPRNLYGLDVLWFCNGTAGPELSWASMDVRLSGGQTRTVGFIARGQDTEDLSSVAVNTLTAADGVTPLRAFMTLQSLSGSINLEIIPVQGFMQRIAPGPFVVMDQSSRIIVDGREGFGDFGVVQNALHGEHIPTPDELSMTCVEDGLTDFVSHEAAFSPGARKILEN